MEYSETILGLLEQSVAGISSPARELRREAEQIRLGRCKTFVRQLERTLGYTEGSIDPEKLRQHFLEAARRMER